MYIGSPPEWIIALVAVFGAWAAWDARRKATLAATKAELAAAAIEQVHRETNSMRIALEKAAEVRGHAAGRKAERAEHGLMEKGT